MSSQNIEIVRRLLERWSNDDPEGFIEGVDPELEWRTSGIYPDVDPIYHGHRRLSQVLAIENYASWDEALDALESHRQGTRADATP